MNGAFLNAYIEDLELINESSKNMIKDKENIEYSDDDELTAENSTTIAEDAEDNYNEDGWPEEIIESLSPILDKLDSFIYEIKNCKRGSFTGANNVDELKTYINELAKNLVSTSDTL